MRQCFSYALGVAFASVAFAGLGYDGYREWKLVQEWVGDSSAGGTYRRQSDFTKPMHGPWLTNPAADAMTVTYISREKCAAAVEYRIRGTKSWTRQWNTLYGMLDYSSEIHAFHLAELRPATEYEYRFVSAPSSDDTGFLEVYTGREIYAFRTLDPKKGNYKVFVTTDIHGMMGLVGDPLYSHTDAAEADFYLFLGDNVEDCMNTPRYAVTFGFLDDVTRLWGTHKPTVFLRGNHDCWGRHAADGWRDYFSRPDGKGYYAFSQGPVLFVVFDFAQEDPKHRNAAAGDVAKLYASEQLNWFAKLKDSARWKKSVFRVVLSHYGARSVCIWDDMAMDFARAAHKPLNDPDPARRIHLLLCGHEHHYARMLPHTKGYYHNSRNETSEQAKKHPLPFAYLNDDTIGFTEICGARWEGLSLEVSPRKLIVRSHDWKNPGAPDLDAVEILPNGTARRISAEQE